MNVSENLYNASLQLFDEIKAIRAAVVDYENRMTKHGENLALESHLRNGRDALRLAQVHFFQLSEVIKSQGLTEPTTCSFNGCSIEPDSTEASLIWLTALTVIGILLWCAARCCKGRGAGTNCSPPPHSSLYRNEQNEEEGHWPLEPEEALDMLPDQPRESGSTSCGRELMTDASLTEQLSWSHQQSNKLDKLLSLFPVLLTHFTMLRNQQARQHDERIKELNTLKREITKTKTDIAIFKHRLEDAETNYYSVSLTARMIGVVGLNARERLLNCSPTRPECACVLSSVAEQILGTPTPPDWILASRIADNLIRSHFPGLGTRLSWDQQLPGIDPSGAERFRNDIQERRQPQPQGQGDEQQLQV